MSLFIGCYERVKGSIAARFLDRADVLSRGYSPSTRLMHSNSALIKYDIGAFGDHGLYDGGRQGFCVVAGDPLLDEDKSDVLDREIQLQEIFIALLHDDWDVLARCRGNFALACYRGSDRSLVLAADANGTRPLYFLETPEAIFYGGSLRMLLAFSNMPNRFYLEAEVERYLFGAPLGDKSTHPEIKVLRNGEILFCRGVQTQRFQYFRWDNLPKIKDGLERLSRRTYELFEESVRIRAARCNTPAAFLSGGLDSRCVVAVLQKIGKKPICFNFYKKHEKDELLARQFADKSDIRLFQVERPAYRWSWGGLMADALLQAGLDDPRNGKGRLVFSGDGGSVGVGRVYLDEESIETVGRLGPVGYAKYYIELKKKPPLAYLKQDSAAVLKDIAISGMVSELTDIRTNSPGRMLFLFYLLNDQRRHLHNHYETILEHKIELLLPFMDKRFYECVVSAPTAMFLYHSFYHNWLCEFPEHVSSVPWQTYPGHLRCPIARSDEVDGKDQWAREKPRPGRRRQLEEGWRLVRASLDARSAKSSAKLRIKRWRVLSAGLIHLFGVRDFGYLPSFLEAIGFDGGAHEQITLPFS